MSRVTVVCGPPGSGKTSYVGQRAAWGDLILDMDTLYQALSGRGWYDKPPGLLSYVFAARDGALKRLEARRDADAWIVTGGALRKDREELRGRFDAEVIVLETSAVTCLLRIAEDERRVGQLEEWMPRVLSWWQEYEPSDADTVIRVEG